MIAYSSQWCKWKTNFYHNMMHWGYKKPMKCARLTQGPFIFTNDKTHNKCSE
jgi:hypothetical protein